MNMSQKEKNVPHGERYVIIVEKNHFKAVCKWQSDNVKKCGNSTGRKKKKIKLMFLR